MDPAPQSRPLPPRGPRKRNRPAVSCGHCRSRKLKCSRTQPCDSCHRSGDASTCSYDTQRPRANIDLSDITKRDAMMARIDRLESLLVAAMAANGQPGAGTGGMPIGQSSILNLDANGSQSLGNPYPQRSIEIENLDVDGLAKEFGIMKVDQSENSSTYLGGVHWVSIMSEIEEFRSYLEHNHETLERNALERRILSTDARNVPSLLRGATTPSSREELESYVPSRDVTDKLVDRFFSFYSSILPIIHEPTFRNEYHMYWIDSTTTKIIWLGVLFAMLHLAELSYAEEIQTELKVPTGKYKLRTIQCLISANYTNPIGYTIETLMLYTLAEWMVSQDPTIETSMVLNQAIRLAMRMGIHRDSKAFPNLTPFCREMRRRIWSAIHAADILFSFQLSLPSIIRQSDCDCGLPMNIMNEDFGEHRDLPPPRGLHEATEVSFLIIKYQMSLVLGNIVEFTSIKGNCPVDTVKKLEHSLFQVQQMIPPHLQIPEDPSSEPLSLKREQIFLDRILQLGQCLLHRKFLHRRNDPAALRHRQSCIDAAMKLLSYQSAMFLESASTHPQHMMIRNKAAFTSQEFFVAGMVVALDLHYGLEVENVSPSPSDISIWGFSRRAEMVTALDSSTEFWGILKDESIGAAKAHGLFSLILNKVKKALIHLGETTTAKLGQEEPEYSIHTELLDNITEFDWEMWESYNGESGYDIESILQYPIK